MGGGKIVGTTDRIGMSPCLCSGCLAMRALSWRSFPLGIPAALAVKASLARALGAPAIMITIAVPVVATLAALCRVRMPMLTTVIASAIPTALV